MIGLLRTGAPHEIDALLKYAQEHFGSAVRLVDADGIASCDRALIPWIRAPHSLAPLAGAWRSRRRRPVWIDLDGAHGRCGLGFFAWHAMRTAVFLALDSVARVLAWLLAKLPSRVHGAPHHDGPVCIVLPVVPDLSHTFIYREAVRMASQDPKAKIVVLERGLTTAPDHFESRQVCERATFVPRHGIVRRYAQIFGWMLRRPLGTAELLRRYARDAGGIGGLFGKLPLREPRHPGNAFAVASVLGALPPGPIHVYGSTYSANVIMGASTLLRRRYSITSYVDFDFDYAHRMLDDKFATSRFFRVCTSFCRGRMKELVDGADDSRLPVILFGLDLDRWSATPEPARRGVLFSASRLVPKKGLHHVPPALVRLRDAGVPVEWRVAGDGPERKRLHDLVRQHGVEDLVAFLGARSTDEIREELRHTDLAVLPCVVAPDGERDGIPIFLNEAMALGVPVLTTPVSGIPELIRDGDTGFLVEPDSPHALADRIREVLADDEARSAVAERGRAAVHDRLDIEECARELLDLVKRS